MSSRLNGPKKNSHWLKRHTNALASTLGISLNWQCVLGITRYINFYYDGVNMEHVICKDCKHSFKLWDEFFMPTSIALRCKLAYHPTEIKLDPVTGPETIKAYHERCGQARGTAFLSEPEKCGKDGKHWEPKNKRDLFKYIKHVGEV